MARITINADGDVALGIVETLRKMEIDYTVDLGNVEVPAENPTKRAMAKAEKAATQLDTPAVRVSQPTRRANVKYHVTRKGRADASKLPITAKAREVLVYLQKHDGRFGLSELQGKLAGKIEPKTVDGSIYALRKAGYVESREA